MANRVSHISIFTATTNMNSSTEQSSSDQSIVPSSSTATNSQYSVEAAIQKLKEAITHLQEAQSSPTGSYCTNHERVALIERGVEDLQEMALVAMPSTSPTQRSNQGTTDGPALSKLKSYVRRTFDATDNPEQGELDEHVYMLTTLIQMELNLRMSNQSALLIVATASLFDQKLRDVNEMLEEYRAELRSTGAA